MTPTLAAIIKSLILPPGCILIAYIICIYLYFKKSKIFIYIVFLVTVIFYVLSIPFFSKTLSSIIEPEFAFDIQHSDIENVKAIVVLGCNRHSNAPEFQDNDTVSECTLARLRYAAILQKQTDIPILVSGGKVFNEKIAEAELMKDVLKNEFGSNVQWTENISKSTLENAKQTSKLLNKKNINEVLLVTHAIHMLRAKQAFNKYNINVLPAPTYYYSTKNNMSYYFNFLPSINALYVSKMGLYEIIGYLWAKLRLSE